MLVSAIIGFSVICLYKAGELCSFSSYIHPLQQDQLFGLGYSYYDKTYKFHMTDEVERPEVLALGSSRIMQVKRSVVSPDYSFYNVRNSSLSISTNGGSIGLTSMRISLSPLRFMMSRSGMPPN